jgi:hypothetical protein
MEGDLKQLLRDRADEARVEPTIPPVVLRRARRRRAGTVAITGLVVAAVATTAVVGVRAFNRETPIAPSGTGEWQGIWPQDTREEALEAQQQVVEQTRIEPGCTAQGPECLVPPDLWQLDAEDVVVRFATQVLGWEEASVTADLEPLPDEPGPVKRLVKRCAAGVFCAAQDSVLVTAERLLRSDRTGLWFVTAWESPASNAAVVAFVSDFLQARIAGSGAERFLSAEAERTYREERDGLSLYGGDRGAYGGFDIYTHPRETETGWSIVVLVKWPDPKGEEDRFVAEALELGQGEDTDGLPRPLLVRSVFRDRQTEREVVVPVGPATIVPDEECGAPGSVSDLSLEPGYTAGQRLERWTTSQGCDVRLDVLMTRQGPEHCGWQRATDILLGDPLGASHMHGPARVYVRDPENVVGDPAVARAFEEDADLPIGARDTGYRQDGVELWMDPTDDSFVYLVSEHTVERWPQDPSPAACF